MALSPHTTVIWTKEDAPYNIIPNASIEIRVRNSNGTSGALASIFSDADGLLPITQPGALTDDRGSLTFYIDSGEYNEVYTAGSPITQPFNVGAAGGSSDGSVIAYNSLDKALLDGDLIVTDKLYANERVLGNGGGGHWLVVLTSAVTPNGYNIVQSIADPSLSLKLVHNGQVKPEQFGAMPDKSEDAAPAFQAAIDDPTVKVITASNNYLFHTGLTLKSYITLDFHGADVDIKDGAEALFVVPTGKVYFTITGGHYTCIDFLDTFPVTSWFKAHGYRSGGVNFYSQRYSISNVRVHDFWWFIDCEYSRTFQLSDFFSLSYNGIRTASKCVEVNISDGLLFGRIKTPEANTRGIFIEDSPDEAGMYCEGMKYSKVTVDQFTTAAEIEGGLDCAITDCWLGTGSVATGHILKFTQGFNNFFRGIHLNNNTYRTGLIEFVSHATPVTTAFVKINGGIYLGRTNMVIGQFWHDIEINDLEYVNDSASYITGIYCVNDNQRLNFKGISFKGNFNTLINVSGTSSKGSFSDIWADSVIDGPFYLQSPIRVVNSQQGNTVNILGQQGQLVLCERINRVEDVAYGADLYRKAIKLMPGAMVEVTVGGRVSTTATTGQISINLENATLQEQGTGWNGKYLPVGEDWAGVYKLRFIVNSSAESDLWVENSSTPPATAGYHTWISVAYI